MGDNENANSQNAQIQLAKYTEDLLKFYHERPKVLGLFDAPVPPLPPFTPHDERMWLIWSSAIAALFCAVLSCQLLSRLIHWRRVRNGVPDIHFGDDELEEFKAATDETDDEVADTFLCACDGDAHRAVDYYLNSTMTATAQWPPRTCVERANAFRTNSGDANKAAILTRSTTIRGLILSSLVVYVITSCNTVLSSDAYAVLGLTYVSVWVDL
jgi:hypothetical protein